MVPMDWWWSQVRKFKKDAPDPRFRDVVRSGTIKDKEGVVIMTSKRFEKELRQRMD